jgi:hypothetical protein
MNGTMTKLEKVALTSAVSGAVFNVFLYGIGATLSQASAGPLFYMRVLAAILQATAFDLVAIATVSGMYHGKRSNWSMLTAVTAAAVSILIALDVAGVWQQPWLHAANALIVLVFTLHLLAPRKLDPDERARLTRLDSEVTELWQLVAERDSALTSERQAVASLRRELASRPEPETVEVIFVAKHRLTWQQLEQTVMDLRRLDSISTSTIRRRVAQVAPALTVAEEV